MRSVLSFIFWSIVFGVAYTQAPLYYSNQNQYFLHGLAEAGDGFLDQDWLANTRDPTPVFSAGVELTYGMLTEKLFHAYYLLLQGLYFWSLVGIFTVVTGIGLGSPARLLFITLLVAAHSALLRLISAQTTGVDYPWFLQVGVAGQYILGFGLQPSVFGVLLLASIHAFLRDRPWEAAIWATVGAIVHATYLLGAAMLVLSYMLLLTRAGQVKKALGIGALALALVAPCVLYSVLAFAPTRSEDFAIAQNILVHFRLPHHAEVGRWLDGIACAQTAWMVLAILLVRRTRLCVIMLVVLLLSLALTVAQVLTSNDSLALLFPWRTSAVLVPLATTVVLGKLAGRLGVPLQQWPGGRQLILRGVCWLSLLSLVAGGAAIMYLGLGYRTDPNELPLLEYVRTHRQSDETYLLPVHLPKPSQSRGIFSTNFTPAPRPGTHLIAIDLQRFRIYTGAPIYVDFKSIPYQDVEVLEWHRRLLWSHGMYANRDWNKRGTLDELSARGITHVVAAVDRDIRCDGLETVYADRHYKLYRLAKHRNGWHAFAAGVGSRSSLQLPPRKHGTLNGRLEQDHGAGEPDKK